MKIVSFAASNSSQSINRQLLKYAETLLENAEVEHLNIHDYEMPIYSADREQASGIPDLAHQFRQKISDADGLLISFAEHNGNYTAAYKNLFDWCSRIDQKVYQNKPMVMLATSPGPGGAQNVLKLAVESAQYFGGNIVGSLSIPSFNQNFDREKGILTNAERNELLKDILQDFCLTA